jgi:hypothetical protein
MAEGPLGNVLHHLRKTLGPLCCTEPTDGQLLERFT